MAHDLVVDDAYYVRLGYDQQYLDDNPPLFVWTDSDSDFSDGDRAPLTPPQSPERDGPDLSWKAWTKWKWADMSRGIEPRDSGFAEYETWKSYVLSQYPRKVLPAISPLPAITPLRRSDLRKKPRSPIIVTERVTRSKTSAASVFYELDHDNETSNLLPITCLTRPPISRAPYLTARSFRVRKHQAICRVRNS